MKILLMEDDPEVLTFVEGLLQAEGFLVAACQDWPECEKHILSRPFDCFVFDRHVPAGDSLALLIKLGEQGESFPPVLFLTALDSLEQKLEGLKIADDYLAKPFAGSELVARVRALLRRRSPVSHTLTASGVSLNRLERRVTCDGHSMDLNTMEFKLLEYLLLNKNHTVSRKMLLENVWEYDFEPSTSIVETYISRLRGKFASAGRENVVQTLRGLGYSIHD